MSRVKVTLKAPHGVTEAQINGTYYWPDENGEVETTNEEHVSILKKHGFEVTASVSIMRPALSLPLIEVDELGRAQLAAALTDRGLSYPESATRGELAEVAHGWNNARRGRQREENTRDAAPIEVLTSDVAPAALDLGAISDDAFAAEMARRGLAAPAPAAEPVQIAKPDFMSFDYDDLKGWLTARGVEHRGNQAKAELAALAAKKFDEMLADKLAA